jgi:flagellar hook-basal body complex protein FliE
MNINSVSPNSIGNISPQRPEANPAGAAKQIGTTFEQALQSLSQTQANSDMLIEQLAAGENVDIHQVMIASEQTDINFRIALAIRDKLVESYREVMRMAV